MLLAASVALISLRAGVTRTGPVVWVISDENWKVERGAAGQQGTTVRRPRCNRRWLWIVMRRRRHHNRHNIGNASDRAIACET